MYFTDNNKKVEGKRKNIQFLKEKLQIVSCMKYWKSRIQKDKGANVCKVALGNARILDIIERMYQMDMFNLK